LVKKQCFRATLEQHSLFEKTNEKIELTVLSQHKPIFYYSKVKNSHKEVLMKVLYQLQSFEKLL